MSATRRGPALLGVAVCGRLGQGVEDGVEQVTAPPAVQGADDVRLAEAERPQHRGVGLGALVVDLVGGQHDRACLVRRSTLTTASSASVAPTVASTTNSTASAAAMATSAWALTAAARPSASGSQPPVSTTVKRRPRHCAS